MNDKEKEIFSEILKNPKIFNKRGSVSPGIFAKYPEVVRYCEEQVKKYPEFESASNYFSLVSRGKWLPKCIICGKDLSYKSSVLNGKKMHCNCRNTLEGKTYLKKKIEEGCIKKYGRADYWNADSYKEKYNSDFYKEKYIAGLQSITPEKRANIREKVKQTCLKRYGVTCSLQAKCAKEKGRKTIKEKYGYDGDPAGLHHYLVKTGQKEKKLSSFSKKAKENLLRHCEEEDITMLDEYVNKTQGTKFTRYYFKCNKCGNVFEDYYFNDRHWPICRVCKPKDFQSSTGENELIKWLSNYTNCTIRNKHIIEPYELDIFIPDKKVAIEFNGIYWHSEEAGIDKQYHVNKTNFCEEKGIQLIHIFEDEWEFKKNIVKARLKHILGFNKFKIYARKCEVREISHDLAKKFIDKYHIQGMCNSSVRLGLFYKNRLVSVMTFGHSRYNKKYKWELLRFVGLANFNIIGGASKLLSYFRKHYEGSIISYADRRWSIGNLYKVLNFKELSISPPAYWYIKNHHRYNRVLFQKHKLKNLLENFDPNLTEQENMRNNKYKRIWDCGNRVFVLE